MTFAHYIHLIEKGIPKGKGAWADLGSGEGTFTMALATLAPEAAIYSVAGLSLELSKLC